MSAGFLRRRVLPWTVWLATMSAAAYLWHGTVAQSGVRGYVQGVTYGVMSPQDGRLRQIMVVPGQQVHAGDVIARLDDAELRAELETLAAKRKRVDAKLGAVAVETDLRLGETNRGIEETVDTAEVALKQARADRSVQATEFKAMDAQLAAVKKLVDERMADRRELADLTVKHAALRKGLQVADGLISQLEGKARLARARRTGESTDTTALLTDPLRVELEVIDAKEKLLNLQIAALSLRAPGDGEITTVHLSAGEFASSGTLVATIRGSEAATASGRSIVFACASEAQTAKVRVGEEVILQATEGGGVVSGFVQRLAPEVAELPLRCRKDPQLPMLGRGVFVATQEPLHLLAGQTFLVRFTGRLSDQAEPLVAPPPAPTPPLVPHKPEPLASKAIVVPDALATRTRFEPSGILWSAVRGRYLVVSDDTGLDSADNHAPWLFSMDETGQVDDAPIVIEGVKKLNDIESIAPAPDGGVYILASQSHNKGGKRSKSREFFGHIDLTADSARVTHSVRLGDLVDDAGKDTLAALGLGDPKALDIEGMTATAEGGLLLGLKSPVGPKGAQIWHLANPDVLLQTGDLSKAGLTLWGHVPLTIMADGEPTPAGIADLLELPDGTLLVAATASGAADPKSQDGALFKVAGQQGLPNPTLERTFPGLKPEGLARAASGENIVVVFDTGAQTPLWTELQWSAT